jgi:phosphohistidine phosphatase
VELYLVRHAEAVALGEQGIETDDARPLTEAGEKQAKSVGAALRQRDIALDKIVTSPLLRATQTAEAMLRAWTDPKPDIVVCSDLAPDGRPKRLRRFLRDLGGERIALVGHMPHLGEWTAWLIGGKKAHIDLAKAGVAHVATTNAKKGRGTLVWLLTPEWLEK